MNTSMKQLIKISLSCCRARFCKQHYIRNTPNKKESLKFISIQNSSDVHTCPQSTEECETKIFEGFFSLSIKKEKIKRSWMIVIT